MIRGLIVGACLILAAGVARAEEPKKQGDKLLSGMSVVGNDEAPKSLVIVPWKSASLGDGLDVDRLLDDGRQPVDRDVFRRELNYYQIRKASLTSSGAQKK